jgi:hypothetical protein
VNKEKIKKQRLAAYAAVHNAKKRGILIQLPCCYCGSEKTEAHHPDYSKPLDVVWLCRKHHRMIDSTNEAKFPSGRVYKSNDGRELII